MVDLLVRGVDVEIVDGLTDALGRLRDRGVRSLLVEVVASAGEAISSPLKGAGKANPANFL